MYQLFSTQRNEFWLICNEGHVLEILLHPVSLSGFIFVSAAEWTNGEGRKKPHTQPSHKVKKRCLVQPWLCRRRRNTGQAAILNVTTGAPRTSYTAGPQERPATRTREWVNEWVNDDHPGLLGKKWGRRRTRLRARTHVTRWPFPPSSFLTGSWSLLVTRLETNRWLT